MVLLIFRLFSHFAKKQKFQPDVIYNIYLQEIVIYIIVISVLNVIKKKTTNAATYNNKYQNQWNKIYTKVHI